eukprot:scaffold55831_cov34-Tisochrysis_lutea.AAC.2
MAMQPLRLAFAHVRDCLKTSKFARPKREIRRMTRQQESKCPDILWSGENDILRSSHLNSQEATKLITRGGLRARGHCQRCARRQLHVAMLEELEPYGLREGLPSGAFSVTCVRILLSLRTCVCKHRQPLLNRSAPSRYSEHSPLSWVQLRLAFSFRHAAPSPVARSPIGAT